MAELAGETPRPLKLLPLAMWQVGAATLVKYVRFGSKADIVGRLRTVRFTAKSGHSSVLR
jgi:single-stranded DNA-binding protein